MTVAIRERRYPSGEVRLQADIAGVDAAGVPFRKRLQVPRTVSGKANALRWAEDQRRRLERGEAPTTRRAAIKARRDADERAAAERDAAVTVARACEWYVEDAIADRLSPATVDLRRRLCAGHVAPVLGARPVRDLNEGDVQALKLLLTEFSVGFAGIVLRALRGVLLAASRRGVPVRVHVRLPRGHAAPSGAPKAYAAPDFERLVAAARELGPQHLVVVLLCGEAGLRRGELLGLKVADAAAASRGVLLVERERIRAGGGLIVKAPKNNRARTVPLSPRCAAALVELAAGRDPGAWLLTQQGDPTEPATEATVLSLCHSTQRRAGLPLKGPHALRHSAASGMLAAGVDVRAVQAILGHARLQTTAIYLTPDADALARAGAVLQQHREAQAGAVTSAAPAPRPVPRRRAKRRDPA